MFMKQQDYKVGAYLRISRDDANDGESGSITVQRELIKNYCEDKGLNLCSVYQDDGFSGVNFERPDFLRMIDDVENGKINCIIVKDLSRLGRDYIMAGYYTEVYFPNKNIRFIALGDDYDSLKKNSSNNDFAPFKFLVNDYYAKDLSKKQRASRNAKYQKGEFVAAYAPYGYKKQEENCNQLILDEETAPIVEMIFQKYADGMGRGQLRDYLRENKIPTPLAIKHMRGERYSEYMEEPHHRYEWSIQMIATITKNEFYLGHTIHLRYRKENYKSKMKKLPKDEHLIIRDTHEPLISLELWEDVKKRFRIPVTNDTMCKNIFVGLVKCADCGKSLNYGQTPRTPKMGKRGKMKKITRYLTCATYSSHGKSRCTNHYASYDMLSEVVKQRLNQMISMVHINEKKVEKAILESKIQNKDVTTKSLQKQLAKNEKRLVDIERILLKLYEDRITEVLSDQNFTNMSTKLQSEQNDLVCEIESIKENLSESEVVSEGIVSFIDIIKSMEQIEVLDEKILNRLIDKIDIGEKTTEENGEVFQSVEISYKFIGKVEI